MSGHDDPYPGSFSRPTEPGEAPGYNPGGGARRGDDLGALDPQPIGALQSSTIVTLLAGAGAIAVALGFRWKLEDAQAKQIADAVAIVLALVVPMVGAFLRTRAASIVKVGAKAAPAVVEVAKLRRDAIKAAVGKPDVPGSSTQRGGRVPCLILALLAGTFAYWSVGCQALANPGGTATTQPAVMSPIVRVYVARQVYASALPSLTTAIDAGLFDRSPDVLRSIAATRRTFENALNQAESYAVAGRAADFNFWIAQVDSALAEFLKLSRSPERAIPIPAPTTRPAARPTGFTSEVLWVPLKSPPSFRRSSRLAEPSPTRGTSPIPAAILRPNNSPRSAPRKRWRRVRTIARSATH